MATSGQGSYTLQSQYRYLNELILNQEFNIHIFVADFTAKNSSHARNEIYRRIYSYATCETILVNVDLKGESREYPHFAQLFYVAL